MNDGEAAIVREYIEAVEDRQKKMQVGLRAVGSRELTGALMAVGQAAARLDRAKEAITELLLKGDT